MARREAQGVVAALGEHIAATAGFSVQVGEDVHDGSGPGENAAGCRNPRDAVQYDCGDVVSVPVAAACRHGA